MELVFLCPPNGLEAPVPNEGVESFSCNDQDIPESLETI